MSRIHDALRRGRAPAGEPNPGRTAHADSVLAALGYRSDKPRATLAALKILGLLAGVLLVVAWFVLPPWRELFPVRGATARGAGREAGGARREARDGIGAERPAVNAPPAGTSLPAPAPEPNSPPVSVPTPAPSAPAANPPVVALPSIVSGPRAVNPTMPALTTPLPIAAQSNSPAGKAATPTAPLLAPTVEKPENAPPAARLPPRGPDAPRASRLAPPTPAPDEFQLALYYQRSGDFEQALLNYKAALARDEMNVEAHNNLGHLYLGRGIFDNAVREFERVVAIDPKYTTAHVNLSAAYYAQGMFDRSAAEARTALQQQPRNPDALVNLALAQQALGQTGDAQGSLRRALEIDKHNAAAHYNMARQFEAVGEASAAIDHYNKFIQYASPEQTAYAADVRARLAVLGARIK